MLAASGSGSRLNRDFAFLLPLGANRSPAAITREVTLADLHANIEA